MIFFYGIKNKHLKTSALNANQIQCQHCHSGNMLMSIVGRYAHFFWIPLFSIGKTGVSHCEHCKQVLRKREFTPQLNQEFIQLKQEVKAPFWFYIGLIAIGILFILPILTSLFFWLIN